MSLKYVDLTEAMISKAFPEDERKEYVLITQLAHNIGYPASAGVAAVCAIANDNDQQMILESVKSMLGLHIYNTLTTIDKTEADTVSSRR